MINIFKNKTTILGILAIVILGILIFTYLNKNPADDDLLVSTVSDQDPVAFNISNTLIKVKNLNLDKTVFDQLNSLDLKDFSKQLPPVSSIDFGKNNPFVPINFNNFEFSNNSTTTVKVN